MNEKIQIIFGLLGGLAVFIYGMNMMSECLQKAAGDKMKSILALLTKNPILGVLAGALTNRGTPEQQCDDSYGDRFRKCGTDEPATGNFHHFWCQYWYNHDSTDYCV